MGKRYHCDYCDKTMVAAPSIIKTHNKGLAHQKLVLEHYRQFKDPETVLLEESNKKPCIRYPAGLCQFGALCRFSHYSREEIDHLREVVAIKKGIKLDITQPSFEELYQNLQNEKRKPQSSEKFVLCDYNGITHELPWMYNPILDSFGENLPASIRRLHTEDFQSCSLYHAINNIFLNLRFVNMNSAICWTISIYLILRIHSSESSYKSILSEEEKWTSTNKNSRKEGKNLVLVISADDNDEEDNYRRDTENEDFLYNFIVTNVPGRRGMYKAVVPYVTPIVVERRQNRIQYLEILPKQKDVLKKHERHLKYIIDFLTLHMNAIPYILSEVTRIEETKTVLDLARKVIITTERSDSAKFTILEKCVMEHRKKVPNANKENWAKDMMTNQLTINVVGDYIHEGIF